VQVHCDEGVATHIGPKPCACAREDAGEASVGECIGQPLSREIHVNPGADTVPLVEGNMAGRAHASARPTRRGRRPWHVQTLLAREPGDLASGQDGSLFLVRTGKARSRSR
jgi:hypothetical protein